MENQFAASLRTPRAPKISPNRSTPQSSSVALVSLTIVTRVAEGALGRGLEVVVLTSSSLPVLTGASTLPLCLLDPSDLMTAELSEDLPLAADFFSFAMLLINSLWWKNVAALARVVLQRIVARGLTEGFRAEACEQGVKNQGVMCALVGVGYV
jgi:hypothetical protein